MIQLLIVTGLIAATPIVSPPDADCAVCSCRGQSDPSKAREQAAAVLEVVALDSTFSNPPIPGLEEYRVRLRVGQVWKGPLVDTISVVTSDPRFACGFPFARGERYLMFLYRSASGKLAATICSLSAPWAQSADTRRRLGPPLPKKAA